MSLPRFEPRSQTPLPSALEKRPSVEKAMGWGVAPAIVATPLTFCPTAYCEPTGLPKLLTMSWLDPAPARTVTGATIPSRSPSRLSPAVLVIRKTTAPGPPMRVTGWLAARTFKASGPALSARVSGAAGFSTRKLSASVGLFEPSTVSAVTLA